MKNLILILLCVIAFSSVKAIDLPTLKIDTEKSFVLNFNDWNNSLLNISIIDEAGEEIYEDTILPVEKRNRRYDLRNLPKGAYKLVISDDFKSVNYDIQISNQSVESVSEGMASYFPQIRSTRESIDINLLALRKEVKIDLVDENGNLLYNEDIKNHSCVTKRLNIAKLERGEYLLRVNVGDDYYTQLIKK